ANSLYVNCGDNPDNHAGLIALNSAVHEPRPTYAHLQQVLDVDRFMSMMAIEVMLCHWDGYTMNRNNWRVFHDLDSNPMVFIPPGLDQLFGTGRQFDGGDSLMPQSISGDVARAFFRTQEGPTRYRQRAAQLCTNVFKAEQIVSRIDEIVAGIVPAVAPSHPQ